jgi:Zn-dependent metalloprotease
MPDGPCFVVPSNVIARVAEVGGPEDREAAIRALGASSYFRARRDVVTNVMRELSVGIGALAFMAPPPGERRTVYDVEHGSSFNLPGLKVRGEGDPPVEDEAVNQAYAGAVIGYEFYKRVFGRNSVDGRGMEIVSSVHYGQDFDNALWNGAQMLYGDGSGRIMARGALTRAIDVIAHEITHGVTQTTAGLQYHKQSGALNESFSDVLGSLVKQYCANQTAEEADWLIGEGILGSALQGTALRSLKDPGKAFELDNQPGHMSQYADLPDDNDPRNDNGGVHVNSGIPNRAFYLAATAIGGPAWEKAGRIWYVTLTERLRPTSDFLAAATSTVEVAGELFGRGSMEQQAVRDAWQAVGVL